jgi:RNA polymerase sigma-70 factor (ECF subfamily)
MGGNGERDLSFGQAALQHLDALHGFAMVLTRNQTDAEDLVQETYLRAVQAFDRLIPGSNLKAWLFAIMRNVWLNQLRHKRSGPLFVELDGRQGYGNGNGALGADPYVLCVGKLEREEILTAMEQLPQAYREIILLRHVEGFNYRQISSILGCPAGTVMSRLGRAREKLRSLLPGRQSVATVRTSRAVHHE